MKHHKYLKLCSDIRAYGGNAYIVGGYVRDMLMGRDPKDVDIVVVGIKESEFMHLFPEAQAVGNSFPVYHIDGAEIALARKERKTGLGHNGFQCETRNVTLEEDLRRRDFRINAIALDPLTDRLIDPYRGTNDIQEGVLHIVGPHFGEDPLRVLRAARFAAQLEFTIGQDVIAASQAVWTELMTLPGERIWGELEKALRTRKPSLFFEALDALGALEIVFPEIYALKGRIQPEKHHPEGDAYIHTLQVIDRARDMGADDETMFAALTHDLGKAVTPDDNLPHHYNHEALGVPLVEEMCKRLCIPNTHRRVATAASREHLNVHRFNDLKPITKARLLTRLGVIQDLTLARRVVMAAKADARGRGPTFANVPYEQGDALLKAAEIVRQVKGHQFAHLKDGRVIAQKMEQARGKVLHEAGF